MDLFEKEVQATGYKLIAGVDEAGRGPLAGPVVAAAVIFHELPLNLGIKDSKALSPKKRDELAPEIFARALAVGVGIVWQEEIDEVNIHHAALKAMAKAIGALIEKVTPFYKGGLGGIKGLAPDFVLVDGRFVIPSLDIPQKAIVSGDCLSVSIAAASIIAKTTRDRIMKAYHNIYPGYNFARNKGYGTEEHVAAILRHGRSPVHRKTFALRAER